MASALLECTPIRRSWPVAAVQNPTAMSSETLVIVWPLGEKAQNFTAQVCPWRVWRSCPVAVDHSFIVLSEELLTMVLLSGEKEHECIAAGPRIGQFEPE